MAVVLMSVKLRNTDTGEIQEVRDRRHLAQRSCVQGQQGRQGRQGRQGQVNLSPGARARTRAQGEVEG
ncbi:MAG: hypothetical protein IPK80_01635 [Nannocystis sp.]|nr:hypothetical protein [Nannocystis sp.]